MDFDTFLFQGSFDLENVDVQVFNDFDNAEEDIFRHFMDDFEALSTGAESGNQDNATSEEEDVIGSDTVETEFTSNGRRVKARRLVHNDRRKFYCDAFFCLVNAGDHDKLRDLCDMLAVDNTVIATCWLNDTKGITKTRYREITGKEHWINYITNIFDAIPDGILRINDRKLYVNPDDSSMLVANCYFSGSQVFEILVMNASNSVQRMISRFNPFAAFVNPRQRNDRVHDSTSGESSGSENNTVVAPSRKRKNHSDNIFTAILGSASLARERKIAPEQIVSTNPQLGSRYLTERKKKAKPRKLRVHITLVYYINPQHLIYRVETFKRLETKVFGQLLEL